MDIKSISNQPSFSGKVFVLSNFSNAEKRVMDQQMHALNNLVKNEKFDLFVKKTNYDETIVGTDKKCGYPVLGGDYIFSARLALRDALNDSYLKRKAEAIKEALLIGGKVK